MHCLTVTLFALATLTAATPSSYRFVIRTSKACSGTLAPPSSAGALTFTGVNIPGFEFGCGIDGSGAAVSATAPLSHHNGKDGAGQMQHFVKDDGFNIFRLPVSWQFLSGDAAGVIKKTNFNKYDELVQACLATGARCIVDIHNYGRFNGQVIGQGGPSDAVFVHLWSEIASRYKSNSMVVFGIMNEPHDLDIKVWAQTVQKVVTAIRATGAATQLILLPGNHYSAAGSFIPDGSADALSSVVDADGSTDKLIFDVHHYLDSDSTGKQTECVSNGITEVWKHLVQWLRCNGRQALVTETGGGNTNSCVRFVCEQVAFQAQNSDVILGYLGWAAGSFRDSYALSEVPTKSGNTWKDTLLVEKCLSPYSGSQRGAATS